MIGLVNYVGGSFDILYTWGKLLFFGRAGDQTQSLAHSRLALITELKPPAWLLLFLYVQVKLYYDCK